MTKNEFEKQLFGALERMDRRFLLEVVPMIDYKAGGMLIGAVGLDRWVDDREIFLVWVERDNGEYVVSDYIDGMSEWVSGAYFSSNEARAESAELFAKRVIGRFKKGAVI